MMDDQQQQQQHQQSRTMVSSNQNYVMDGGFMKMRLDTRPLIEDIRNFLSSQEVVLVQDKEGNFMEQVNQIGLPLANAEGIMRLCNIVKMRINHHVVQGNMKEDHYWDIISRARKEITETVVKKCYDWEIHDSDLSMIIDEISALVESFMTRLIGDKERQSFSQQLQAREVIMQPQEKRGFLGFGKKPARDGMT